MATNSSPNEIPESLLHATNESFTRDPPITEDIAPGDFFDDPNYLQTLPHIAKAMVCAIQHAGDNPNRPGLCHIQSEMALARYKLNQSDTDLSMAFALEALSLRYVPDLSPGRGKSNHHMGTLYQIKWERDKRNKDLDASVRHYKLAVKTAQEADDILREWACDVGVMYVERYRQRKEIIDKENARVYFDKAIELTRQSPIRARHLSNKGDFLRQTISGENEKSEVQLAECIAIHDLAIEICDDNPGRSSKPHLPYGMIHRNAAAAYNARFTICKKEEDGTKASFLLKKAITFEIPETLEWQRFQNELANLEKLKAEIQGDSDADQKACDVWREVIEDYPDALKPRVCLAEALQKIAEKTVDRDLAHGILLEAIDVTEDKARALPPGHRDSESAFLCCATTHYALYEVAGETSNLDKVIEYTKTATNGQNSIDLAAQSRLRALALIERYELLGRLSDLVEADSVAGRSFSQCRQDDAISQGCCLWVTGKVSRKLYDLTQNAELLQKACRTFQKTCELMPKHLSSRPLALNDLGNTYVKFFNLHALPHHLEKAIDAYKEALTQLESLNGGDQHRDTFMITAALGSVMVQRFLHWRADSDIESAVRYYRKSLSRIDNEDPRYAMRAANLSYALQLQFEVKGNIKDLTEAQQIAITALDGPISLSDDLKIGLLTLTGDAYQSSYKVTAQMADLQKAIETYDKTLTLQGAPSSSRRGILLLNKATALAAIANATGKLSDFDTAERALQEASSVMPEGNPLYWTVLQRHANVFYEISKFFPGPTTIGYASKALEAYERLARMSSHPVSDRIHVASIAAQIANDLLEDPVRARDNILISLELLPEAVLLHESRLAQLKFVRKYQYIPGAVAALSLKAGDPPSTAIQRLESGRAFIWDRIQGRPSELDDLQAERPELAGRFRTLRLRLFQKPASSSLSNGDSGTVVFLEDEKRLDSHNNANAYRQTLEEIRQLPGFSSFLRTSNIPAGIQSYSTGAPIVFINANPYQSDAIIVTDQDIKQVPLPDFSMEEVQKYALRFAVALHYLGKGDDHQKALAEYQVIMKWLWKAAAKPVMDSIDWGRYQQDSFKKPRIIWVSAGWLSILPIHAAGDFESQKSPGTTESRCVHDIAVSSYTNSLKALAYIRQGASSRKRSQSHTNERALVAAMAQTPGLGSEGDLNVTSELNAIENVLSPYFDVKILMQPNTPSVKGALSPETTILHFACHARADGDDPSRSAIMLQDWQKKPSPFSVRTLLNLDLKSCELVYLSACESGVNKDVLLRDEGIHVAGGFHIAGVSHVISTLWKVSDDISTELAGIFYSNLKQNGQDRMDLDRAPYALHDAVGALRQRGVHPMLWGAFIHSGP
jgi:tetratricopeptide (TPR) repeat protein